MNVRKDTPVLIFGKWPPAVFGVVFLVLFILELMAYAWLRVQHVKLGYALSVSLQQQQEMQILQTNLLVELSRLQSPERLARVARHLQLKAPSSGQIILVPGQ